MQILSGPVAGGGKKKRSEEREPNDKTDLFFFDAVNFSCVYG